MSPNGARGWEVAAVSVYRLRPNLAQFVANHRFSLGLEATIAMWGCWTCLTKVRSFGETAGSVTLSPQFAPSWQRWFVASPGCVGGGREPIR
jgi:hypothetical protein